MLACPAGRWAIQTLFAYCLVAMVRCDVALELTTPVTPAPDCSRWVDKVWKLAVLNEYTDSVTFEDFYTFIAFMDEEWYEPEMHVKHDEFSRFWRCTMMSDNDVLAVFKKIASYSTSLSNTPDPLTGDKDITDQGLQDFWTATIGQPVADKDTFTNGWETVVRPVLEDGGCEEPAENRPDWRFCVYLLEGGF